MGSGAVFKTDGRSREVPVRLDPEQHPLDHARSAGVAEAVRWDGGIMAEQYLDFFARVASGKTAP